MYIRSKRIYTPNGCIKGILHLEDGKIVDILNYNVRVMSDIDADDLRIIPGIIDTHNHGTMGYSLMGMDNQTEEDKEKVFRGYLKGLASQGVTACLPTADHNMFKAIVNVCKGDIDGARPLGIHSEGPYLNRVGEKGIDTGHPDIDLKYVEEMYNDSEGMLKLMGVAPELEGSRELIEYLTSKGVRVAFTHSNMNYHEALEAFKWGITVTTHTANVMAGIHHRNMGGLGACLLNEDVYNELICDGLHVSNEMIELMLRVKRDPFGKFMMISDNVPMAGAPVGRYNLGGMGLEVNIDEKGYCLSDTGRLCGSTVPVIKGIKNMVENVGVGMKNVIRMASENPAKVYGATSKGRIEAGMDADIVIINDDYDVLYTLVEGKVVYDHKKDTDIFNNTFLDMFKL